MSNHIEANKEDIAKVVIMPGDPLRAKNIAENYLHNVKQVNSIRNMLAYTGYTTNNVRITVMGSGMGQPSIGIYCYELYNEYDVELIIRVGTCGIYDENINLGDLVIVDKVCTDSAWPKLFDQDPDKPLKTESSLIELASSLAKQKQLNYHIGEILTSDVFYDLNINKWRRYADKKVLGVEMESYALYCSAKIYHKKALTILTATDHFVTKEKMNRDLRSQLSKMPILAIAIAEQFLKFN